MSEFIAHEIEITTIHRRGSEETDHLQQCNASVHAMYTTLLVHIPIHISIDQAKYDCLVPDQSLIVTLGIADRLFLLTAIGQLIPDVAGIPVFVTMLFDELDPEIGDIHG